MGEARTDDSGVRAAFEGLAQRPATASARWRAPGRVMLDAIRRMLDPSALSDPEKCLVVAACALAVMLWTAGAWLYSARHPNFEPFVDHGVLRRLLWLSAATMAAWGAVLLWALVARRRPAPSSRLLVGITVALFTYHIGYTTYVLGLYTNPFPGATIIGAWTVSLILFPRRTIRLALAAWWLMVLATLVAEQAGLLPYAPLYRSAPFEDGRLHASWLLSTGGVTLLAIGLLQVFVYVIIERWQDREQRLAVVSQQLAQANEVISRYVASQLADQVRSGNYDALERHERRRLTLFFSDIKDFAATADVVEPEDFSLQLNEYLSAMTAIAERYEATIDKFVGDAIMIFFGAPASTSDRDQALRAVRMAVEMQRELAALRQRWAERGVERAFHTRMGINTGQASVGAFGSRTRLEYTAIGRQVNLAARLQAQCEPDRILLSHSTYALVRDEIECTPKGEVAIKGFREPVKVYEVVPSVGASAD